MCSTRGAGRQLRHMAKETEGQLSPSHLSLSEGEAIFLAENAGKSGHCPGTDPLPLVCPKWTETPLPGATGSSHTLREKGSTQGDKKEKEEKPLEKVGFSLFLSSFLASVSLLFSPSKFHLFCKTPIKAGLWVGGKGRGGKVAEAAP